MVLELFLFWIFISEVGFSEMVINSSVYLVIGYKIFLVFLFLIFVFL